MNLISAINITLIYLSFSCLHNSIPSEKRADAKDTLYVLYEEKDENRTDKSKIYNKKPYVINYPVDFDRRYNIINNNCEIWFNYSINYPNWSELIFDFRNIKKEFIENHDFKDQEWFRKTPKEEIYDLFLGEEKVVYLVEKDRIKDGKAIMIRVYPDIQTVE